MAKEWAKPFYKSKAWQSCREAYISERMMIDGGMCEKCNKEIGMELHHIIFLNPANINDANITLNFENLKWLCKDCHFEEHREAIIKGFEMNKKEPILQNGTYFDENGMIQQQKVCIVYGSPRSGKTTYVMKHRDPTDIIIDLDAIMSALLMTSERQKVSNVLDLAIEVREFLLSKVKERSEKVDCKTVWIIAGLPDKAERESLAKELKAELIFVDTDYETCIQRAKEGNLYNDIYYSKYVVDKWWKNFRP